MQASSSNQNDNTNIEDEDWDLIKPEDIPKHPKDTFFSKTFKYTSRWIDFKFEVTTINEYHDHPLPINKANGISKSGRLLQQQSPLFRLPSEIRIQIYEDLLSVGEGTRVVQYNRNETSALAILRTCARALIEAEEIFYSINRLSCGNHSQIAQFLHHIGPTRREAITKWSIACTSPPLLDIRALAAAKNLESLHINVGQSVRYLRISDWRMLAKQLISEMDKLPKLKELDIEIALAKGVPEPGEEKRQQEWEEVVRRLKDGLAARTTST